MRDLSKIVDELGRLTVGEANTLAQMLRSRWEKPRQPSPMLSRYEGEVCDAMVQRLEEREGHTRASLRWPEKENHQHPVDFVFKLGEAMRASRPERSMALPVAPGNRKFHTGQVAQCA
jgi:hypothetical protein